MSWVDVEPQQTESEWVDVEQTPAQVDFMAEPTIDTSSMDMGQYRDSGVYEAPIGEDTGGTIAPEELQKREDDKVMRSIGEDMEKIRSATTSTVDSVTGDTAKMDEEAVRLIKEKYNGVVQNRGGEKVIALPNGSTIPYPTEGSLVESVLANKGEMGGAITGATLGAKVGAIGGPVGMAVGGAVGGAVGAGVGAYYDVGEGAEATGTEVSEEERRDLAMTAGVTDLALGVAGGTVIKGVSKLLTPAQLKNFTSVADLPKKQRVAVESMMEKADLNEGQMNKYINDFVKTTDEGVITNNKAVEAAAKGSEVEPSGYILEAMKDPEVKAKVIRESTSRSDTISKAVDADEELATIFKGSTVNEGDRKATNWVKLESRLKEAGFEKGDAIYDTVADNAKSIGTRDVELFNATVRPIKPDEGIADIPLLKQWSGTARGSIQTQRTATGIQWVDSIITKVLPNKDAKTVTALSKAIKGSDLANPKQIEQSLVDAGIDRVQAKRTAQALEIENAKQAKVTEKKATQKAKEFEKTKVAMQKEGKEDLKLHKESMKRDASDWDIENLDATVSAKDKTRLKEARRRSQMDAKVMEETASDTEVFKIQKEILDKKQAVADRKTKLDKLKKEADEPPKKESAMMAGLKQPELPLEPSLFDKKKPIHTPKRRKATPNQEEAARVQEANPDDKEAIKKALTRKSDEVAFKKRVEEGLEKEKYERSLDPRTDAEIKANKAVEDALDKGVDLYDTKPVFKKAMVSETIPSRAKEFDKWVDENPTKEFLHYATEKGLSTKEVKSYYSGLGKAVPKSWKESTSVGKGIKVKPSEARAKHFKDIDIPTKVGVAKSWERNTSITNKMVEDYYKEIGKPIPNSIINSKRRAWKKG